MGPHLIPEFGKVRRVQSSQHTFPAKGETPFGFSRPMLEQRIKGATALAILHLNPAKVVDQSVQIGFGKRLGIFDLTEKEIHEKITIPRMNAYGKLLGVTFNVSEWRDDGMITVTLVQ